MRGGGKSATQGVDQFLSSPWKPNAIQRLLWPLIRNEKTEDQMPQQTESKVLGVSWRGWLVLMVFFTGCLMSVNGQQIPEPLGSIWSLAAGFYLGQKAKEKE